MNSIQTWLDRSRSARPAKRVAQRRHARGYELSDAQHGQVEDRKHAAARHVGTGSPAAKRIASAPPGYLLAHGSGDIARHCQLLSPLPAAGEVRVVVTPGRGRSEWHLDIGSRDRSGLLAAFTGVLSDRYLDVAQAVVATWDDGAALEAFVIRSAAPPDAAALQIAFEGSLGEPLSSSPMFDARVTFNNDLSSIYTRCDVRASDRVGLLHAVAVAIAASGADVHAASVATENGSALDSFDLSSPDGRKLDATLEEAIEHYVRNGVAAAHTGPERVSRRARSME